MLRLISLMMICASLAQADAGDYIKFLDALMRDSENADQVIENCRDPYNPSLWSNHESRLFNDAKEYLENGDREAMEFQIGNNKITMIFNRDQGNGCCAFFTKFGSYVSSVCAGSFTR